MQLLVNAGPQKLLQLAAQLAHTLGQIGPISLLLLLLCCHLEEIASKDAATAPATTALQRLCRRGASLAIAAGLAAAGLAAAGSYARRGGSRPGSPIDRLVQWHTAVRPQ